MTVDFSDVELPQDQEPLNPDAPALPVKPWSRRAVLMAVTLGIVATFGTMAILVNGASGHDAGVKHYHHIQLLKQYARMRNKKFAPLFLRYLAANDEPEFPTIEDEDCKAALNEHEGDSWQDVLKEGTELLVKAAVACYKDGESDKCKEAAKAHEDFEKKQKEECEQNGGELCTLKATDKHGEESEQMCIPSKCHDNLKDILNFAVEQANHVEHGIEECKDFECKASFECGEEEKEGDAEKEGDEEKEKHAD